MKPVRSYRMVDLPEAIEKADKVIVIYSVPNCGRCDVAKTKISIVANEVGYHFFSCSMDKRDAGIMFRDIKTLRVPIIAVFKKGERTWISEFDKIENIRTIL